MWSNLRLRTQLLIGYGTILVLAGVVIFFLASHARSVSQQISGLNTTVTGQVTSADALAAQVADTRQAIDQFMVVPSLENLNKGHSAIQRLRALAQELNTSDAANANTASLVTQVDLYNSQFRLLALTILEQAAARRSLVDFQEHANQSLRSAIDDYNQQGAADSAVLAKISEAQSLLSSAQRDSTRLIIEGRGTLATSANNKLTRAQQILNPLVLSLQGSVATDLTDASSSMVRASEATHQYARDLELLDQQRSKLIDQQSAELETYVTTLTNDALGSLTNITTSLENTTAQTQQIGFGVLSITLIIAVALGLWIARLITRPLIGMLAATRQINQGNYNLMLPEAGASEVGQLSQAFNQMANILKSRNQEIECQQQQLAARNTELQHAFEELRDSAAARDALEATVRAQSVPVVPITAGVVLIPLVGELDTSRSETLMRRALDGVTQYRARQLILDITGVPMIDRTIADTMLSLATALRLLGAECVLVGVAPEVAQTLVSLGADFGQLTVRSDLREAVAQAMRHERNGVQRLQYSR